MYEYVGITSYNKFMFILSVVANVMKSILNNLKKINKTMSAIPILKYAISKLQETPDQITQLHYVLCQACLMSNNLKPALSLLEQDVYVLDNSKVST